MTMSIFEIIMLLCFGFAWPTSIYRSYKARSNRGKSIEFLIIILIGYMSGILHKFFYAYDFVIFLYAINLVMVAIDLFLYFRNKRLEESQPTS